MQSYLIVCTVTFTICLFGFGSCTSDKPNDSSKITIIADDNTKEEEKRAEWSGMKAAWGKRNGADDDDDIIAEFYPVRDIRGDWDGLRSAWGKRPSDWQGLSSAWGKRADWQGMKSAWGKRGGDWKGLQSAWGKRGDGWKGLNSAWGKRAPVQWDDASYIKSIKDQLEAIKNRRSNWQSLASWGR